MSFTKLALIDGVQMGERRGVSLPGELELRLNRSYHDFHNHGSTHSASHSVPNRNSSQPKTAPSPSCCKHILDESPLPNIAEIYSTPFFFSHSTLALAILMVVNSSPDVILYHRPPVSHCHEDGTLGHRVRCSYPLSYILLLVSVRLFPCTSLTAYLSPLEWL
ncbi:hypothetical protein B0H13DRAFT_1971240 [Mycena leptocephala]|nr:hypothetical protein B0H13DRAFT_1971240 [Mycena leptocephala]